MVESSEIGNKRPIVIKYIYWATYWNLLKCQTKSIIVQPLKSIPTHHLPYFVLNNAGYLIRFTAVIYGEMSCSLNMGFDLGLSLEVGAYFPRVLSVLVSFIVRDKVAIIRRNKAITYYMVTCFALQMVQGLILISRAE